MSKSIKQIATIAQLQKEVARTKPEQTDKLNGLLNAIDHLPEYIGAPSFGKNEQPIIMVANFILRRFPSVDAMKLVEAFELAASGELYENGRKLTVSTYGRQINIDSVGKILSAYKDFKRTQAMQPPPAKLVPESHRIESPEPEKVTAEWHYERLVKEVLITKKMPEFFVFKTVYEFIYPSEKGKRERKSEWYAKEVENHLVEEGILTITKL